MAQISAMKQFRHCIQLLVLILALGSVLPAQAEIVERNGRIFVNNDRGGNVMDMVQTRSRLENSGKPVWIRGYCRSACTIYITLPNACLGPKATVGFHAPRLPGTTIIPPLVDQIMAAHYRNGILRKWNAEWKHSLKMHKISARDYVRLDPQTRLCRK